MGMCTVLIIATLGLLFERRLKQDLRGRHYLRTSGPVEVWTYRGTYMLRLADRAFSVNRASAKVLSNFTWAIVEYSRNAHLVLSVKDQLGNTVFSFTERTVRFGETPTSTVSVLAQVCRSPRQALRLRGIWARGPIGCMQLCQVPAGTGFFVLRIGRTTKSAPWVPRTCQGASGRNRADWGQC